MKLSLKTKNTDSELLKELKSSSIKRIGCYQLGSVIGQVRLGKHILTSHTVAIKIVDKIYARTVEREIETWRKLKHPNIAQLYEILTSESKIYMVTEYAQGGELFDFITKNGRMVEKDAQKLFIQLLSALKYCHEKNIVHRDLKLENIMLDDEMNIKLIDFGFTREYEISKSKFLETYCGSPAYAAPEMILGKKYSGPEADIWSMGIILFALVTGYLPFDDDNEARILSKIIALEYEFPDGLSDQVRDLIEKILRLEPSERMSINQIINHQWLSSQEADFQEPIKGNEEKKSKTKEHFIILYLSFLGFDTKALVESLLSDVCNPISSLYYILLHKFKDIPGQAFATWKMSLPMYYSTMLVFNEDFEGEKTKFRKLLEAYADETLTDISAEKLDGSLQRLSDFIVKNIRDMDIFGKIRDLGHAPSFNSLTTWGTSVSTISLDLKSPSHERRSTFSSIGSDVSDEKDILENEETAKYVYAVSNNFFDGRLGGDTSDTDPIIVSKNQSWRNKALKKISGSTGSFILENITKKDVEVTESSYTTKAIGGARQMSFNGEQRRTSKIRSGFVKSISEQEEETQISSMVDT